MKPISKTTPKTANTTGAINPLTLIKPPPFEKKSFKRRAKPIEIAKHSNAPQSLIVFMKKLPITYDRIFQIYKKAFLRLRCYLESDYMKMKLQ